MMAGSVCATVLEIKNAAKAMIGNFFILIIDVKNRNFSSQFDAIYFDIEYYE
jgi:hypothetical protein